jgi:hypothetical protein
MEYRLAEKMGKLLQGLKPDRDTQLALGLKPQPPKEKERVSECTRICGQLLLTQIKTPGGELPGVGG